MLRLDLDLTLESDVIASVSPITTGGHETLDHLRGSLLAGALAHRFYSQLGASAFPVFHGGSVRFHDALLLTEAGELAYPAPAAWVQRKTGEPRLKEGVPIPAEAVRSRCQLGRPAEFDEPVREGLFTPTGHWLKVKCNSRLKTAIDRSRRGAALEGSLHLYQSIPRGTHWRYRIAVLEDGLAQQLRPLLQDLESELLWLGRSRGAEYGRVRIDKVSPAAALQLSLQPLDSHHVVLFLLSDTAPIDPQSGEPAGPDCAEAFGLPALAQYQPAQSVVSLRRYAPWNATRGAPDLERVLLSRGSVLTYRLERPLDSTALEVLDATLARGIGAWRQEGCGEILRDLQFVTDPEAAWRAAKPVSLSALTPAAMPDTELAHWMNEQLFERRKRGQVTKAAEESAERYAEICRRGRQGTSAAGRTTRPPGRAQWQRLAGVAAQLAHAAADLDSAERRLRNDVFEAGMSANTWSYKPQAAGKSLQDLLLEELNRSDSHQIAKAPDRLLAMEARSRLRRLAEIASRVARRLTAGRRTGEEAAP